MEISGSPQFVERMAKRLIPAAAQNRELVETINALIEAVEDLQKRVKDLEAEGSQRTDMTAEQMVRDILEQAIADGIVKFCPENFSSTHTVQNLSAGDVVGLANLISQWRGDEIRRLQRLIEDLEDERSQPCSDYDLDED